LNVYWQLELNLVDGLTSRRDRTFMSTLVHCVESKELS
jgi:hypothetical protein